MLEVGSGQDQNSDGLVNAASVQSENAKSKYKDCKNEAHSAQKYDNEANVAADSDQCQD